MHHISISSSSGLQATKIEEVSLAAPTRSVSGHESAKNSSSAHKETLRNTVKETDLVWCHDFFGKVSIQSKSSSLSRSNTRRLGAKATTNEKIITIMPIFFRKTLELRFRNSFGQISRTLSTYPILENSAPIFQICITGDLHGLQVALSSGNVSPFVLDQYGLTLLHVSPLQSSRSNQYLIDYVLVCGV